MRENMALETLDFNKKILHASWHPRENTIAVGVIICIYISFADGMFQIAATNNLFSYSAA